MLPGFVPQENAMHPSDLFSATMEQQFNEWLTKFASLEEMFSSRHQLYSKLRQPQIEGIIDEHVTIIGSVHVGPYTHVRSGAILKGPLIVGPNSVIEYGVRVLGGSFIGAGTHLNSNAVVSNSLLMNNCLVGENSVVQNSVLGFGVATGAGSLIGDVASSVGTYIGDGSKLGVGSIICSGSLIPPGQIVSAGTVVSSNPNP
jgi:bifunctional UDP-N-acetylglucosamine pyrophosphorylase / glucosamine-1-phosphate N-acetyltransferase